MDRCKEKRVFILEGDDEEIECNGYYHPAGCMGARYSHIDLDPRCSNLLREIAFKHGIRILCRNTGGCIVLELSFINRELTICCRDRALKCRDRVYLMISRKGLIYIGEVVVH